MKKNTNLLIIFFFVFVSGVFAQSETDTKEQELRSINRVLDRWHERAAVADTAYFDLFAPDAMYLGTDSKEIWTVQQFKDLYIDFFKRGTAWNFKKKKRDIYLGDFGHYAWADETLDTWMGLCRGNAVMEKDAQGKWKIKYYSLTVLVPNEVIKDYVTLLKKKEN